MCSRLSATVFMMLMIGLTVCLAGPPVFAWDESPAFLGCFGGTCNAWSSESLANPNGAGSQFRWDSPTNPFGPYGSPFSATGARNSFTTDGPAIINRETGEFSGTLNSNRFDADSIANPFGRYGSPFSTDSPNNPLNQFQTYDVYSP